MNLSEKFQKVNGYFSIESYDIDDNLINKYEDPNQIMIRVPYNFAAVTYGIMSGYNGEVPQNMILENFAISSIAIGTDGLDENGEPKKVLCNRDMLFSEENLWEGQDNITNTNTNIDMNKYVYQTTFHTNPSIPGNDMTYVTKITEGPSFPWDIGTNKPAYYTMDASAGGNGLEFEDTSMFIKTKNEGVVLEYNFTLGQFAGNGIWQLAPSFSEAGLYMKYIPEHLKNSGTQGRPLGALFCMKTFPKQFKTEACYFRIKWKIIFGEVDCVEDISPTIILNGGNIVMSTSDTYVEQGATAFDSKGVEITANLIITPEITEGVEGVYYVYYNVTDSYQMSSEIIRTVQIIEDCNMNVVDGSINTADGSFNTIDTGGCT